MPVAADVDTLEPEAVPAATESDDDNRKFDLDTRLLLLIKDKSAIMPAFLIGSDSSEEDVPAPTPPPLKAPTGPPPPSV